MDERGENNDKERKNRKTLIRAINELFSGERITRQRQLVLFLVCIGILVVSKGISFEGRIL